MTMAMKIDVTVSVMIAGDDPLKNRYKHLPVMNNLYRRDGELGCWPMRPRSASSLPPSTR